MSGLKNMTRRAALLGGIASVCVSASGLTVLPIKRVRIVVVLADNENQGIVPVKPSLGDGQNPRTNLYWGALYGIKTYFGNSENWSHYKPEGTWAYNANILARASFRSVGLNPDVEIHAEAWAGDKMRQAISHFYKISANGFDDELVVFVGHNGLMDSRVFAPIANEKTIAANRVLNRSAMVLACSSSAYFKSSLEQMGVTPLVMTTGLMAPEAYSLEPAIRAWARGVDTNTVRNAAASGYAKYQKIPQRNAKRLFSAK